MFVDILFILVILITAFIFFDENSRKKDSMVIWVYVSVIFCLAMMAAFRPIGIDKDSLTYLSYYEGSSAESLLDLLEPSFVLISSLAGLLGDVRVLFVVYALLAIPVMAYGITRLTALWFLSLLIWVSHYFLIQDLTQIRVAVSTGLFVFALKYLAEKDRWRYAACMAGAVFFHFSAVLLCPFMLLGRKRLTVFYRIVLFALPLFFYFLYVRGIDILTYLPVSMFQERREVYETLRDQGVAGDEINVFNAYALIRLLTYYMLLWKYDVVVEKFESLTLLIKIMCVSICLYAGLAFLPALAIRSSEVCGVVDILLIPWLAYTVRPFWLGKVLVAFFGVILFLYNIYVSEYLQLTM